MHFACITGDMQSSTCQFRTHTYILKTSMLTLGSENHLLIIFWGMYFASELFQSWA